MDVGAESERPAEVIGSSAAQGRCVMGNEPKVVTVTLIGGPEDGLTVDVRESWNAYRPPSAKGAYKKPKGGGTQWVWSPDPRLK